MPALRQPAATSALEQAEAALAAAKDAHERARVASMDANADAASLRASVKAGNGSKVTPADISEADALADHAALAFQGAAAVLPALGAAVLAARADEAADEVVEALPQLGRDVANALDSVADAIVPFIEAALRYDSYVESAIHRLEKVAPPTYEAGDGSDLQRRGGTTASPFAAGAETPSVDPAPAPVQRSRVKFPRYGVPSVDGVALSSCRGPSQLAAVLLPIMRELGGQQGLLDGLKLLAAGAPQLPRP